MPTVEVNGDLSHALNLFKRKTAEEGVVSEYKRRQAFTPPHEEKARKMFRSECRRKRRERGKD